MPNLLSVAGKELRTSWRAIGRHAHDPVASRARWSPQRAHEWHERTGWLVGCNFIPSSAGNQLEMWQRDTFDPETIDRELGWAAELGMNSVRVFLHDLAWQADGDAFLDRVEQVLELAAGHGISMMPVLFDGIWDPDPRIGPQRPPRPGVHNSIWLQSPGAAVIGDEGRWPALRPYVEAVIGRFGADPRVVVWDLFNEPDSPNPYYARREPTRKSARVAKLLDQIADWADVVDPDQPLTVGVYARTVRGAAHATPTARVSVERSDVVSFHCYRSRDGLERTIDHLAAYGRPMLCTEWMARPGSPVELLDVLAERGVSAYNWGLVDGRTQTKYPWTSWIRPRRGGGVWFHELLHPDGTPYDPAEVERFRRVTSGR
jgi:hypothetical protein